MEPGSVTILRSKWLAVVVHLGLWALLALVVYNLGGTAPSYRDLNSYSLPIQSPAPVSRIGQLLSPSEWPSEVIDTNAPSPFHTTAFLPPPKPVAPKTPPATTRKVAAVYQGFFSSHDGPRTAVVKLADAISITPLGSPLVTNHYIADLTFKSMTLTNAAGETNLLLINTAKELEIPIK
jgi:hypothetical protein